MKKTVLFAAVAAISLAWTGIASAATQINGALSLSGGVSSFTSTSITFGSLGALNGTSGDLTALGTGVSPICSLCVTFPASFSTSTILPAQIFSVTNNGNTSTGTLGTVSFVDTIVNGLETLTVSGNGTITLTGFVATPMSFVLTANRAGSTFSMSASAVSHPVPVPAALPLFATGMAGLWALGRRRKKQKVDAAA